MLYALYAKEARIDWSASDVFRNEIRVCVSFTWTASHSLRQILVSYAQSKCFPRAIAYLDSGAVNIKGMVCALFWISASHSVKVSDVYSLQDFSKAVESLKNKEASHIVISPGQ